MDRDVVFELSFMMKPRFKNSCILCFHYACCLLDNKPCSDTHDFLNFSSAMWHSLMSPVFIYLWANRQHDMHVSISRQSIYWVWLSDSDIHRPEFACMCYTQSHSARVCENFQHTSAGQKRANFN